VPELVAAELGLAVNDTRGKGASLEMTEDDEADGSPPGRPACGPEVRVVSHAWS